MNDKQLGESPASNEPFAPHADAENTAKEAYNVVSDTVTGVNARWSDNKFQAIFVLVSVIIAASMGAILSWLNPRWNLPVYGGALIGSFGGLIFGVFASGIFLMCYRGLRHLQGKHD